MKTESWKAVKDGCTIVLELCETLKDTKLARGKMDFVKAYFRRGQALLKSGSVEESVTDLNKANELAENGDALIRQELVVAKKTILKRRELEKAAYSKMFA